MTRFAQDQVGVSSDVVGEHTEVVTLDGEFDMSNAADVEQRLSAAFASEQANIVVDMRGVRFLDATMLKVLLRGRTRAKERGTRFALIRPNALVWRVFVLTGLSDCFPTYPSLREASLER
jgi:anti-sigma B factor antagonist